MAPPRDRGHRDKPPVIASDDEEAIKKALVETGGDVPEYADEDQSSMQNQTQSNWQYLQVIKRHSGYRLTGIGLW